jgi:signal transduction histidine kinase
MGIGGQLPPKQAEYANLIHQSGQHLLNIVNDVLDLAKVDAGRLELHEEEIDSRSLVETCARLLEGSAALAGLRLVVDVPPDIPRLVADPTRIKQALLNLLSNAVKFTERGGVVTLGARRTADGAIEFAVSDTGPGMTPDEVDIALEPFRQLDNSLARQHEGTGLGLPLARQLSELHGGVMHVASEKGRGTTITIRLPVERIVAPPREARSRI